MNKTPSIRFNGFSDNWKEKQLSEIFIIKNNKNKNQYSRDGVLSVSDYEGCVNQIKFHGRSFAGKDISNYKIADIGDIIYTKSPLQSKPYGIVKIVTEEAGIVSPLYIVNVPTKENDSLFMYYLFDSPERTNKYLEPLVRKGAKNTMNISDAEWLSGNVVVSENLEEQQKIGLLFKKIDALINVESSKIDELSKIKQALLLKMFPTESDDIPSIRFKDFTDTWEQRKLGELSNIVGGGTPSTSISEFWDGTINWYAPAELSNQIYLSSSLRKITEKGFNNSSAKMLPIGTVLFTSRAGIGKTAILKEIGCTNQGFQSIIPHKNKLDTYFIYSQSDKLKDYGETVGAGSTFVEVSGKQMSEMPLKIPQNFNEQKRIGNFFEALDNVITLHQRKCEKLKQIKSALLDKLLV